MIWKIIFLDPKDPLKNQFIREWPTQLHKHLLCSWITGRGSILNTNHNDIDKKNKSEQAWGSRIVLIGHVIEDGKRKYCCWDNFLWLPIFSGSSDESLNEDLVPKSMAFPFPLSHSTNSLFLTCFLTRITMLCHGDH